MPEKSLSDLTRYELTIQHGKDGEHVAVWHCMEDGNWVKFQDIKENKYAKVDAHTCQVIVEDLMSFMSSGDMLVGSGSERRVQIRNSLYRIVSGKLSNIT